MPSDIANAASATDWISAIGQAAGAFFTLVAVAVALWLAGRESRAAVKAKTEEAAGHAAMVYAEMVPENDTVVIHNCAPGPIRQPWIIGLEVSPPQPNRVTWSSQSNWASLGNLAGPVCVVLRPGELSVKGSLVEVSAGGGMSAAHLAGDAEYWVSISFFDSDNRHWVRRGFALPELDKDGSLLALRRSRFSVPD